MVIGDGAAIATQHDLVDALARGRPAGELAMNVATLQPLTIRTAHTALDALTAMVRNEVHHLVVIDETGDPVGVAALAGMIEVVLGESAVPHWLTTFRLALRSDTVVREVESAAARVGREAERSSSGARRRRALEVAPRAHR